ncbi:hypothetical protein HDU93_005062 [Gonapodya sp. JEL0774]|nr:hypothetical protein HDU93_005062 [Gonapodya sp. JEL0774]
MGRETARLFSGRGWFVVAVDVNNSNSTDSLTGRLRSGLNDLEAELGSQNVHTACLDVSHKDEFDALIRELESLLPGKTGSPKAVLDVVFANAGIGRGGMWSEQPWKDHLDVVAVNFVGVMVTIYSSLRLMKNERGGLVFSTSSSSAMYGSPGIATYSATKHAVKGLTEALSIELGAFGIRVADTLPGAIDTPLLPSGVDESTSAANTSKSPFRLMKPSAIAEVVWASWVNDPRGTDALGDTTYNRLHWYVPEELQRDIDAIVNTRGGAEKIREQYRKAFWQPQTKDFDGTISRDDHVVDLLALSLGSRSKARDVAREIMLPVARQARTYREGFNLIVKLVEGVDEETGLKAMIKSVEIDPTFWDFYAFCTNYDIPFTILSSGFSKVIVSALTAKGRSTDMTQILAPTVIGSKYLYDTSSRRWTVQHVDSSSTGHDKSAQIRTARAGMSDQTRVPILYLGDGLNDIGPALEADIVFAKRGSSLDKQCARRGIQRRSFDTFAEVKLALLEGLMAVRKALADSKSSEQAPPLVDIWRRELYKDENTSSRL